MTLAPVAPGTVDPHDVTRADAAPTRWLDDDEMAAWLPLIRVMQELPHALDRTLREEVGISHAYYSMLAMLSEAPDRTLGMGELARVSGTTPSRLSHAVDVLEKRGWVSRCRDGADRRTQRARLTDEGLAMLVEIAPTHVRQVRELVFDRLDPDQVRTLRDISTTVLDALGG